jgi:hypothetical protein
VDEIEEDTQVAKKGHTEEQILRALRQAEGGTRVAEICREHGMRSHVLHLEEEEGDWAGELAGNLRRLGGSPSNKTGDFVEKVRAVADYRGMLELLNRGQ